MNTERLTIIETKIAYQEDTIQALNDVIYQQQQRIDRLESTNKLLIERMRDLSESLATTGGAADERPPHY